MDKTTIELARDRRLRRKLLVALRIANQVSPSGQLSGQFLRDQVRDYLRGEPSFESDSHALDLLRSLVAAGYVEESDGRRRRGESFGLEHMLYRISEKGMRLLIEALPPDPMIEDERIQG
jgi:hypothetical protein